MGVGSNTPAFLDKPRESRVSGHWSVMVSVASGTQVAVLLPVRLVGACIFLHYPTCSLGAATLTKEGEDDSKNEKSRTWGYFQ